MNKKEFSKGEIEKFKDWLDKNVLPREEFEGRCVQCGAFLNEVDLSEGPENEVVCLNCLDDFLPFYDESIAQEKN